MKQVTKFYVTSFLKNQTYFTPVMILFLQFYHLTLEEIFWVFTVGSVVSFLAEIPTGIFADLHGKRRSIVISKFGIFVSYLLFGFSDSFWMFVVAQSVYELANSFRTGTETAYTYDYLLQNSRDNPSYTEVKGGQKFYARVGEAIASAAGGLIAVALGYNWVFLLAAVPAFLNFLVALSWEEIRESKEGRIAPAKSVAILRDSFGDMCRDRSLLYVTMNIAIFSGVLAALSKFIQPYMNDASVPLAWFGIVYTASLALTAIAVKYSYLFEDRFGAKKTINTLSLFAVVPAFVIGLGYVSILGVALFFLVVIIENIRSPIANSEFHSHADSKKRATLGSILELSKSLGKIIILPLAGFLSEAFSMYQAILILAGILLLNGVFFYVKERGKRSC